MPISQINTNSIASSTGLTTPTIAQINSAASLTPTLFYDNAGVQVGTLCRAWVNFNGTSGASPVIRASFNISSVVRNGAGDYTVNFSNTLNDANYSVNGMTNPDGSTNVQVVQIRPDLTTTSTSLFRIRISNSSGSLSDESVVMLSVFR